MVYRFLKTLKMQQMRASAVVQALPHYSSTAVVSLFMHRPDTVQEIEREHLAAPVLETAYMLVQDFLAMMRKREGERLDVWLTQVHTSELPELQSFAEGVEKDKEEFSPQSAMYAAMCLHGLRFI